MDYPKATVDAVWKRARKVEGLDENMFRKDACGAWLAVRGTVLLIVQKR